MTNEEKSLILKTIQPYISIINEQKSKQETDVIINCLDYPVTVDLFIKMFKDMGLKISDISRFEKPEEMIAPQNIVTKFTVTWGNDFSQLILK